MYKVSMYIKIKNAEIPLIIRNYKNSHNIKIYFRGNILNISKPNKISNKKISQLIKNNEDEIYNKYITIVNDEKSGIKRWNTGDKILYEGEEYTIIVEVSDVNSIKVYIDRKNKNFNITVSSAIPKDMLKIHIDKSIKSLFKNNTSAILKDRLPYWSKLTNINYNSVNVRDANTRFGSCIPARKALNFNSRLIMLSQDKVDAIIVHELCHIVHSNHSKDFYNLVKEYIPNYDEINQWLKQNSNLVNI